MKDDKQVIREFNEVVNMTADELSKWLKDSKSGEAGWSKDDESGETIGHDSGRKITEILKSNPDKKPDKYTDDQIQHMRKVVAYCKRHLAQEKSSLENKSTEEAKKTKSYISLKNWGHDPLKKGSSKKNTKDESDEESEEDEEKAGDKRKKSNGDQDGATKKRETRKGAAKKTKDKQEENGEEEEDDDDDEQEDDSSDYSDDEANGGQAKGNKKAPKSGETVSWNWGQGQPRGKVLDVKDHE